MHIASLVMGIIALIVCLIPFFDVAVAIIAFIIALIALFVKRPDGTGKGMKITGFILSLLALLISSLVTFATIKVAKTGLEIFDNLKTSLSESQVIDIAETISETYNEAINRANDGKAYSYYNEDLGFGYVMTARDYYEVLIPEFGSSIEELKEKFTIYVDEEGYPSIDAEAWIEDLVEDSLSFLEE
ncbi:MAG: hypothetical protein IKV94_02905 [Clostridia bacterium]|nr:hypothetical protein [Clostridia bacterium]